MQLWASNTYLSSDIMLYKLQYYTAQYSLFAHAMKNSNLITICLRWYSQMLKKFSEFYKLKSLLWCLKEPAIRTYPESLESTPPTKSCFSTIHFKLCFYYSQISQLVPFFKVSQQKSQKFLISSGMPSSAKHFILLAVNKQITFCNMYYCCCW